MANPLERAATRRKVYYLAAIVGLFTVSLLWRGKMPVPGAAAFARAAHKLQGRWASPVRTAAFVANNPIAAQAQDLELRELDQGEPEIAGTAMRLALTGSRGAAVTALWWTAIEKQKRNEWTQFEQAARLVTRLQPNFITPWIFQAWNIAYNVSVENDKLGDMFFYIARGIELLTEGDRLNTKLYRAKDGEERKIGSPDMRYQIGFYYQNKFGVSDKVNTLRSLMQLATIPLAQRDAKALTRDGKVDTKAFLEFCERNPQLVRRLREHVFVDKDQQNPYATPELVVQFLDDNYKIPTRWTAVGELKKADDQFPALPPRFDEGAEEYTPDQGRDRIDDTFDAFHAARAWFRYAIATSPPPKTDETGQPLPWASPVAGEYDQFKYRMPRSPAFILFRQQYPRAQTYLAERLQKEGWFDQTSAWSPDERSDKLWFKRSPSDPDVYLKTPASSLEEWRRAYALWTKHADENALILGQARLSNLEALAVKVPGDPQSLPQSGEFTPEKLEAYKITRANVDAKLALIYYDQNRHMSNFPYFMATSEGEQDPQTVSARKLLFRAETNKRYGSNTAAIRDYVVGLALWREVLLRHPNFHHPERSETTEEQTYEYELELIKLLSGDGAVLARAGQVAEAAAALCPMIPELARADIEQDTAEREAGLRVIALNPEVQKAVREEAYNAAGKRVWAAHHAALALAGVAAGDAPDMADALKNGIAQTVANSEFARQVVAEKFDWMREFMKEPLKSAANKYMPSESEYWVRPSTKDIVRSRLGLVRKTSAPAASEAPAPSGEQASTKE